MAQNVSGANIHPAAYQPSVIGAHSGCIASDNS
jgi:hypothetical protein